MRNCEKCGAPRPYDSFCTNEICGDYLGDSVPNGPLTAPGSAGYPPLEECLRIIADQAQAPAHLVMFSLLQQAKELGMDLMELVHTQYDTAAKIKPPIPMPNEALSDAELRLRERVWHALAAEPGCPPALDNRGKQHRLLNELGHDEEFWSDLLDRHGLRAKNLHELEPGIRQHAAGNFWGMLAQKAHELGWKI